MEIFYICDNNLSNQAGDTIHIIQICENLQRLGHDITLYAPKLGRWKDPPLFKIKYIFSFSKGVKRFLFYQILLFFCLLFDTLFKKPDIIYARANWSPISLFISKLFNKPHVVEIQAVDISRRKESFIPAMKNSILKFLGNLNIRFADMVVTTNGENSERLNKYYGIDREKIEVVPCGIDADLFKDINYKKARKILGLSNDFYYIGFIGSIFDYSGIDSLVKSLPLILKVISNLKLILVGRDETKNLILDLIFKLKLEKDILYIGEIPHSKVPLYIGALDIGLQLRRYTLRLGSGDSIKLYEYFALGKVAIVGNNYKDFIEEINAGIAVDVDSPEEITEAIVSLINDEKRRIELGENGRRFVLKNRTWRASSAKIAKICEKVIKAR